MKVFGIFGQELEGSLVHVPPPWVPYGVFFLSPGEELLIKNYNLGLTLVLISDGEEVRVERVYGDPLKAVNVSGRTISNTQHDRCELCFKPLSPGCGSLVRGRNQRKALCEECARWLIQENLLQGYRKEYNYPSPVLEPPDFG